MGVSGLDIAGTLVKFRRQSPMQRSGERPWRQKPHLWGARVLPPAGPPTADEHAPFVVRMLPVTRSGPENTFRDGSSLVDVRRQIAAARRVLEGGIAPSTATLLGPAGWLRVKWPAERPLSRFEQPHLRNTQLDLTSALPGLSRFVDSMLADVLSDLPCRAVVFGVDFEAMRTRPKAEYCELQGLFVFEPKRGRVVHATTKFTTEPFLLVSQAEQTHLWNGTLLLNCRDLALLGQTRVEPKKGGIIATRRQALDGLLRAEMPHLVLHAAHTLGPSPTWKRNWSGLQARTGGPKLRYATTGRFEPLHGQPLDRFSICQGVRELTVVLTRRS